MWARLRLEVRPGRKSQRGTEAAVGAEDTSAPPGVELKVRSGGKETPRASQTLESMGPGMGARWWQYCP